MTRDKQSRHKIVSQAALVSAVCLMIGALPAKAASSAEMREKRPGLFNAETGLRTDRYRAPVPDDVPGAIRVDARAARALFEKGALAIDVFAALQSRFDELDGTWLVSGQRLSIPDAVWLPEVGRGSFDKTIQDYFAQNLERLTTPLD